MSILDRKWGDCAAADRVWARVAGLSPYAGAERRIMVLQAYIDDSWDDYSGLYVLAGYVSTSEKWALFSKEWTDALPLAVKKKDGSFHFKMSKMNYPGLTENLPIFNKIINKYAEISISCSVNKRHIDKAFKDLEIEIALEGGHKYSLDSNKIHEIKKLWGKPFVFAFFGLMQGFHKLISEDKSLNINESVDFIFDQNEWDKFFVRKIWKSYSESRKDNVKSYYGREPDFEKDEEFLPLQAADFYAWWVRNWGLEYGDHRLNHPVLPAYFDKGSFDKFTWVSSEKNIRDNVLRIAKMYCESDLNVCLGDHENSFCIPRDEYEILTRFKNLSFLNFYDSIKRFFGIGGV